LNTSSTALQIITIDTKIQYFYNEFNGSNTLTENKIPKGGITMSENRCGDWLKGLLVGGLVGVVVGLLFAPKSGQELREDISVKAKDFADKVKDDYEGALEKSKKGFESVISRLKDLEMKAAKKAEEIEKKIAE